MTKVLPLYDQQGTLIGEVVFHPLGLDFPKMVLNDTPAAQAYRAHLARAEEDSK